MDYTSLKADLDEVKVQLKEIRDAIMGNALLNDGGIKQMLKANAERLDNLEERMDDVERKLNYAKYFFMGVGTVGGALGSIVMSFISKLINH